MPNDQPAAQAPVPVLPAPAPVPQPEAPSTQGWREMLTAGISIVILILAMTTFALTFSAGREVFVKDDGKKEAYDRQRDLLGVAIGLLGTVTGYYLGRAPAELRAQTAQGLLNTATTAAAQANQTTEIVKQQARQAADTALAALQSQSAGAATRGVPGAPDQTNVEAADVERARQTLEELKRRL